MKFFLSVFLLFSFLGCTRLQTINLKPHLYSERPSNIIWIQIAGFTDQQIPLLRFNNPDANAHTEFESVDCLGKMWSFNLFDLRPTASQGFLSQLTGSKNIKGSCDDLTRQPIWSSLSELGYRSAILENGVSETESLEKFLTCGENQKNYMKGISFIRMGPEQKVGVPSFHYQDTSNLPISGLAYDKSCQGGKCYSSFLNNSKKILNNINDVGNKHFYLLREFAYLRALKEKDLGTAKNILKDINQLMLWIESQNRNDVLVIITGTEGLEIDFPKEGKEWSEFVRKGKNLNIKNSTLLSTVFAKGPMAENFCGLFDEADMPIRILYKPEGKKFSWDAINPLSN